MVEIVYFEGCPHHEGAGALVKRVAAELGLDPDVRLVNVPDPETAKRLRFRGSPTIRVAGPRRRSGRRVAIPAVAVKEGRESWRGDGCCDVC